MDRLKLNGWQRRRLRCQLRSTRDVRLYRRTLAILELDRGRSARDVALSLGVQPRTVYYWAEAYLQDHDPSSLCDAPRSGRPTLWTERLERRLSEAMDQSPQEHGYPSVDWTVPLLQETCSVAIGDEADVMTIGLVCNCQTSVSGLCAYLALQR